MQRTVEASTSALPGLVAKVLMGIVLLSGNVRADSPQLPAPASQTVDFRRDVYPLLQSRCFKCHQGSNPKSGFRLDLRAELLGETNGKPVVKLRGSSQSKLIHLVAGVLPDEVMPPGKKRLTDVEVGILRRWIDQGLPWDDQLLPPATSASSTHWAFRAPTPCIPPSVSNGAWVRTPVDAFIAAAQEAHGLTPAPEAARPTLIRRLTLDLTGLPATAEEVAAFEANQTPEAYERLVDRLLASPHYGERWGRHWLDVARWAESEGYESNHLRPFAWRYRDWVIRSFNEDKPFCDFVREQLAGDEIVPYSDDNLIATGFLAAGRLSSNEEEKARQRNDMLVDIVNATGSSFLGLTMNCAQCHNHKFDPITARDYYRFLGLFVKGQPGNYELHNSALWVAYEAARPPEYESARTLLQTLLEGARARLVAEARAKLTAEERQALDMLPEQRSEQQEELARAADLKLQVSNGRLEKAIRDEDRTLYNELKKKAEAIEKKLPARPQTFAFYSPITSPTPLVHLPMVGFYPPPYEPAALARAKTHILAGGDVHRRGQALEPGWPEILGPSRAERIGQKPRLALAEWLTAPQHPLTARVYVNRLWHYHFGRGLVATPNDFGTKGAPPSHPELLDWLATEFLRTGGSTKRLQRLIVCSSAYRQASVDQSGAANSTLSGPRLRDPENTLLWQWPARRLEAEAIRDSLLALSGELDKSIGGPSQPDRTDMVRRSVYLLQKREAPPALQSLFDGPSAATESCPRRLTSTIPMQALYLLNDTFAMKRAQRFAARVQERAGDEREQLIETAFRLALNRLPDGSERSAARQFFDRLDSLPGSTTAPLVLFCQAVLNLNEFIWIE